MSSNININFAGPAEADVAYEGIVEYVPIRSRANETPKQAAHRISPVLIDEVKGKLRLAGLDTQGRFRLAAVSYDDYHGHFAHLFFTLAKIRDNDRAIRELAHLTFQGNVLTTRENGRVIMNNDLLTRANEELSREREQTRRERERTGRAEDQLADSRRSEQEGLRREQKQRETITKLEAEVAGLKLDLAAHRLMATTRATPPTPPSPQAPPTTIVSHYGSLHALAPASTTRAPWRGLSALGRGRASTSTTSAASSTAATPPPQAAAPQSTTTAAMATPPPQATTATTTSSSDDDEETGEDFEDTSSIALWSHF